jgi:hypothetical protein
VHIVSPDLSDLWSLSKSTERGEGRRERRAEDTETEEMMVHSDRERERQRAELEKSLLSAYTDGGDKAKERGRGLDVGFFLMGMAIRRPDSTTKHMALEHSAAPVSGGGGKLRLAAHPLDQLGSTARVDAAHP